MDCFIFQRAHTLQISRLSLVVSFLFFFLDGGCGSASLLLKFCVNFDYMNPFSVLYDVRVHEGGQNPQHWFEIKTAFGVVEQEIRWKVSCARRKLSVPINRGEASNESVALNFFPIVANSTK